MASQISKAWGHRSKDSSTYWGEPFLELKDSPWPLGWIKMCVVVRSDNWGYLLASGLKLAK